MLRRHFRTPFSLGLICGLMASVCWGVSIASGMYRHYGEDPMLWSMCPALRWMGLIGAGVFLCLPGILSERLRLWPLRLAVGAASLVVASLLLPFQFVPSCFTSPMTCLPWVIRIAVSMACALLPALLLCMGSNRDAGDAVGAALVCGVGFVPLVYAARLVDHLSVVPQLTLDSIILLLLGPWLGVAMWSFGTLGTREASRPAGEH